MLLAWRVLESGSIEAIEQAIKTQENINIHQCIKKIRLPDLRLLSTA